MSDLEKLIREEINQSELTRRDAPPEQPGTRRGAAAVYSIRLPADTKTEIDRLAKALDIPASALVRGFVLDGLAAHQKNTLSGVVDKLDSDLRKLRELIDGNR